MSTGVCVHGTPSTEHCCSCTLDRRGQVTIDSTAIEQEVLRRVDNITRKLHKEIDTLKNDLEQARFRAAVAEWSVAGIMSRNIKLDIDVTAAEVMQAPSLPDLFQAISENAGRRFLIEASLNFKQHARLAELQSSRHEYIDESHIPLRSYWPRPFA